MLVRRLVLVLSIVVTGLLALAVGVLGAGSGGLAPGSYTFTNKSASAFFGGKGPVTGPNFSVFVNQGLNSFEADDGTTTVTRSTIVIFTMFNPDGTGGTGCFVINPSDFVVSDGLQHASLHTNLNTGNQCPGFGKPLGPIQAGVLPAGGKGGGLPPSIQVDLTWTGANVLSTTEDQFTFTCLDRQEEGTNTFSRSLGGSASGTIAGVSGLSTLSADVASQDGQLEIQGSNTPPCFGK
ncbi:MAG TPA: hypothetical protein VJQ08_06575 [Candidatus Dormibacteraeota bacterium]|nr:hypothetical protein [Candidatus Dormibacteraeota bacterium]